MDWFERMHKLSEHIMMETGKLGVVDMTIESRMFDMVLDYCLKQRLFLRAMEDQVPFDTMVLNFHGRPVTVRRQRQEKAGS